MPNGDAIAIFVVAAIVVAAFAFLVNTFGVLAHTPAALVLPS